MHSWEALDPIALAPAGAITNAFAERGVRDYREAARYVAHLPYGRNASRDDALIVMHEGRGTCSTKHALLRRLALEQNIEVALILGIYEMNERNTPGVGVVLQKHGLVSLPEAHCYLRAGGKRVDVTRALGAGPLDPIIGFMHEEEITPEQIGDYKADLHQRLLRHWMDEVGLAASHTFDDLWAIREHCIVALSNSGSPVWM